MTGIAPAPPLDDFLTLVHPDAYDDAIDDLPPPGAPPALHPPEPRPPPPDPPAPDNTGRNMDGDDQSSDDGWDEGLLDSVGDSD
ncbi:hypothetical protein H0H92_006680, partial [Tricholoma furcatifolium]